MRKQTIWNRKILKAGLFAVSAMTIMAGASFAAGADEDVDAELSDEYDEELDLEDADDLELDFDDIEIEEEELTPEEEEFLDLIDENLSESLLDRFDSFCYEQTMYDSEGKETELTGRIYRDQDQLYAEYVDGFVEYINEDVDDGYDPEIGSPVRYVYATEDTKEDALENYEEIFYLWGDEEVSDRSEADGKIIFTSVNTDDDFVSYIAGETGIESAEGQSLKRVTTFDEETSLMETSVVTLVNGDGTEKEIFHCSITADPEEKYELDKELSDKLNSEDSHSLKIVVSPGTDSEATIESTVGKGCVFYPVIYDGYTFFTDPECTLAATDEDLYEKEADIVLYAAEEEVLDMEDGEEMDIDFDDLFEVVDDEEESIAG